MGEHISGGTEEHQLWGSYGTENPNIYFLPEILLFCFFFFGFQGPVRFYNNERRANILLKQFQHGEEVKIGEYNSLQDQLDFTRAQPIKWVRKIW